MNLTQPQILFINRLYRTGCYGSSPSQVVHRLFGDACLRFAEQSGVDMTALTVESKNGEALVKKGRTTGK